MNKRWRKELCVLLMLLPSVFLVQCRADNKGPKHAYVFAASHLDLFFTGAPPYSYSRDYRMFDAALDLAQKDPNFRYVIENAYLFANYLRTHPEKREAMAAALREHKLELAAQWCLMLQNVATGEDLVRNILEATEFARRTFGVSPTTQSLSDLPGQTPQAPQILVQAGVQGVIFARAGPSDAQLFNWKGLDGSMVHAANLPFGYAGGYLMGLGGSLDSMEGKKLEEFELSDISADIMTNKVKQVAGVKAATAFLYRNPADPALIEVAWDNMMPPAALGANIAAWNKNHGQELELIPMLPGEFFTSHFPKNVDLKTGEIPSVWGNGGWVLFGGYPQEIRTSYALLRAEKWASIASLLVGEKYPQEAIEQAWQNHLVPLDHEGSGLTHQRSLAEELARNVLEDSLLAISGHIPIPNKTDVALVAFNSLNWPRSETIVKEIPLVGSDFAFFTRPYHKLELLDAKGQAVPFEIISKESTIIRTIRVRFRAENVPPLGWKTYYLRPAEQDQARDFPSPVAAKHDVTIANALYRMKFDAATGAFLLSQKNSGRMVAFRYYHQPQEASKEPGFFKMKDSGAPVAPAWKKVLQGTNLAGPYLEAEGEIQGATLKLHIQLDGADPIAISETVDWPGGKVLKLVRASEFPEGGKFSYGVPYGAQDLDNVMAKSGPPEKGGFDELNRDQWSKNREIDGWICWGASGQEIGVASEARGGMFDGRIFKVTLLASGGERLLPDLGAHPVPDEFATRVLVRIGPETESPEKLGWEFYNPLETMITVDFDSTLLPTELSGCEGGEGTILTTLKRAEDGKGWIARGYALHDDAEWVRVLAGRKWTRVPANLIEARQSNTNSQAPMRAFQIRSERMQTLGEAR